jgi:hypothetical protein
VTKKYYLCGVAFQHELGETDEIGIYDTLEELIRKHTCVAECGAVEIESEGKPKDYTAHKWLMPQNFNRFAGPNDYVSPAEKDEE